MTPVWTFKGVNRVADNQPVIVKQETPILSFGKKTDGQQANYSAADKPK